MTDCWPTALPNWPDFADVPRGDTVLSGLRVLVTRTPERAGDLMAGLRDRGAEPVLAPMHQAAAVAGQEARDLSELVRTVAGAGAPAWLVFTSVNTVRALQAVVDGADDGRPESKSSHHQALGLGDHLAQAIAGGLQIAAVGAATARAAGNAGLPVHLVPPPEQSSAAGLVNVWPHAAEADQPPATGPAVVFLPQSASARATLRDGLAAKGWRVDIAVAYRMVDFPADTPLTELTSTGSMAVWDPHRAREELARGTVDAVVATAPSLLRALFAPTDGKPPAPAVTVEPVACAVMGEPTLNAAQELGLKAVAATVPDAAGLLDALEHAVKENRA